MIQTVNENIIKALKKGDIQLLAHGCNCSGGFGSGVAGQIAKEFPMARREYLAYHEIGGTVLGNVQFVDVLPHNKKVDKFIANCMTQQRYGNAARTGKVYCDYQAIRTALEEVKEFASLNNLVVGMPKIGCGLAGGSWSRVNKIIQETFVDWPATIYDWQPE